MKWASVLAASACFLWAQQSDEVRVSAHVYSPPQLRLTAQTTLVQLEAVVRDPRGHAAGGLTQGDFEILDEGKPRDIVAFSVETRQGTAGTAPSSGSAGAPTATGSAPAPTEAPIRSTLLFFDNLHAAPAELQRAQIAARRFIQDGMGAGARAAVYAAQEGLVLDFTSDADALIASIQKLRSHQHISENGLQPCPRITPYQAFLIANRMSPDALNAAVQEAQQCANAAPADSSDPPVRGRDPSLMSTRRTSPSLMAVQAQAAQTWEQTRTDSLASCDAIGNAMTLLARAPGTRVLLLVSAGFLTGLLDTEKDSVIERAMHAGIVIDALDAKGLWSEAPGRPFGQEGRLPAATFMFETTTIGSRNDAMNAVMQEFASGTGGLFFHDNNDLVAGFAQLAAVPETTYLIAFRPDTESTAGQYRKLKVRLTAKSSDYVQTRPGYVTPARSSAAAAPEPRPIDREIVASGVLAAIPIQLTARTGKSEKEGTVVSTSVHVDLGPLKFAQHDGRHTQKLVFVAALLDSTGKMVAAKEGAMELSLKDDTLARLTASGVNAGLMLAAPPGSYQVRVVVEDAEGKVAAQNQAVEIPR
jgi:VWFA-related protein